MALALIRPTRNPISIVCRHSVLPDGACAYPAYAQPHIHFGPPFVLPDGACAYPAYARPYIHCVPPFVLPDGACAYPAYARPYIHCVPPFVLPDGACAYPAYARPHIHCVPPFGFAGWRLCLIRPTHDLISILGRHSVLPDGGVALSGLRTCCCVFVGLISVAPSGSYFFSPANAALISSSGSCTPINTSVLCGVSSPHGRSQSAL